ncbi:hypothetical protein KKH36_02820 [Patescibacteria group bacterium]|nr:hypothetical protein [Patescibacteria group bacterium]
MSKKLIFLKRVFKLSIILIVFLFSFFLNLTPVYALNISVHIPEKYTDVEAGERFYFEVEIKYPENSRRKDLKLNYEILDKNNEIITQAKHLKAIETQASFMDYIVIPENTEKGLYNINVGISDYENLRADVSASFNIISSGDEQLKLYFYVLLGVMLFISILIGVDIIISKKQ